MKLLVRVGALVSAALVSAVASNAHALIPDSGLDATSGCDASSGLACEVCDVSGYTPVELKKPIGPMAADCSDADISGFVTACGISGTSSTCSAWQATASTTCLGCLVTQQTASSWGVVVCTPTCSYNSGGCIDLALGQVSQEKQAGGSGSCGDLVGANFGCQDYACGTCATTDFSTCANSASANECSVYAQAQTSTSGACAAIDGGATETACFPQTDNDITTMATFMCGGLVAQPDAGSDGGTTNDAGGSDSGTKKDAGGDSGASGDSGSDAGSNFGNGGGCHCDAAGAAGTTNAIAILALGALVATTAARRRKRSSRDYFKDHSS